MIKSMTGYGKAEAILNTGKITIEVRTLNGKNADINFKAMILPKEKEIGIRQKITERLQRGTIDFFVSWESNAAESAKTINSELVKEYYKQISDICKDIPQMGGQTNGELLATILRFPDVMDSKKSDIVTEENWPIIEKAIDEALDAVNDFRSREGVALYNDVTSRVNNILNIYKEIENFEGERIETVKQRILKNLEEVQQKYDPSRFEQEMIFYLEKFDINEEKVRLRQHCKYFIDTIEGEVQPGKKLGFIIQEMGREINTTGSKANHAEIQKCVVRMKDELEKIREQSLNIL